MVASCLRSRPPDSQDERRPVPPIGKHRSLFRAAGGGTLAGGAPVGRRDDRARRAARRSRRASPRASPISASGRATAWRCGCPTCRPGPSSISPACGSAPSPSRSTRATAPSRSPTSSAARAPRCWPARRASGASISCRSWPRSSRAALDRLEAIVVVGDEPAAGCRRPSSGCAACPSTRLRSRPALAADHARAGALCNIFTTSGTTSAPKFVPHRQGAIAGHAQQVARAFGFDAPDTLLARRSCRCAACSASTRRWRRWPPGGPRAGRCPTRSTGDRGA